MKPGKTKHEVEIISVTPKMAEEWLLKNTRNRKKRPTWVEEWALAMRQGEWRFTPEPIAFCDEWTDPDTKETHGETLIEGQHRLEAIVLSGITIDCAVWRHCDQREFELMGRGKPRTLGDVLGITRRNMENPSKVAALCTGFVRIGLGFKGAVPPWAIRRLLSHMESQIVTAVEYKKKLKGLANREIMTALILAQLIDPQRTALLVSQLYYGANLNKTDPAKVLRDYGYDFVISPNRDIPEVYLLKVCYGIAAKLRDEAISGKLQPDIAGFTWLRENAKTKLTPILADIFGRAPHGFYAPKVSDRVAEALAGRK